MARERIWVHGTIFLDEKGHVFILNREETAVTWYGKVINANSWMTSRVMATRIETSKLRFKLELHKEPVRIKDGDELMTMYPNLLDGMT